MTRPPGDRRIRVGMRIGAWEVLSEADRALHPDGKMRTRWLCRCACATRHLVFGRDLESTDTRPPRRRSCGAPACKVYAARGVEQIERGAKGVAAMLEKQGIDPADAARLVRQFQATQLDELARDLRARNSTGVHTD